MSFVKPGIIAVGCSLVCVANAAPTGLLTLPTTEVMQHREVNLSYGVIGFESRINPRMFHSNGIVVGLFGRLEIGYDTDFLGAHLANAKLRLWRSPKDDFALSVGIQNWRDRVNNQPYLVARASFSGINLHAGWIKTNIPRIMLGVDFKIAQGWAGILEHYSGPSGFSWAGLNVSLPGVQGLNLSVGACRPNTREDGYQFSATLNYAFKF